MTNYEEFYRSYTSTLEALAKAIHAEREAGYTADATMERKYEEGFADAMAHAFILLTGNNPNLDLYDSSCLDVNCDGYCDSNYCENLPDNA